MTCSLCSKTALCVVKTKGFCGDHRKEANEAMKAIPKAEQRLGSKPVVGDVFYDWRRKA